jgi:DNA-binding CsgD family transcriptional regulator
MSRLAQHLMRAEPREGWLSSGQRAGMHPVTSPEKRALPLIELIYRAASDPMVWHELLVAVSDELGGPAAGLNLEVPGEPAERFAYRVHSDAKYAQIFADFVARGEFPWSLRLVSSERFIRGDEIFPDEKLVDTDFWPAYMQPQGFLPVGPVGHVFGSFEGEPVAAIGIYRFNGGREFDASDMRMLDLLVPHLAQAYRLMRELQGYRNQWDAAREVLDRVPIGVILLDRDCRVAAVNDVAEGIVQQADGFVITDGRPHLTAAGRVVPKRVRHNGGREALPEGAADCDFQKLLSRAVMSELAEGDGAFFVERPSQGRAFTGVVTSLHPNARIGFARDARVAVYLSDPDAQNYGLRDLVASFYDLTIAEAELAALLSAGHSIEEVSEIRGVTLHTARSQLKRVFTKTGVKRQSDLVRLILTNVTALLLSGEADAPGRDLGHALSGEEPIA